MPRLRLSFLMLYVVIAGAVVVGLYYLTLMDRSVSRLTDRAVPAFIRTGETDASLKSLPLLLQEVPALSTRAQIDDLRARIDARIELLRRQATDLITAGAPPDTASALQNALTLIDIAATKSLLAQTRILGHQNRIGQLGQELDGLRLSLNGLLADLAIEPGVGQTEQDQLRNLVAEGQASTLALEIESVIDPATRMHNIADPKQLDRLTGAQRYKLKGIATLIGQLRDNPTRTALASQIADLRALILGRDGLYEEVFGLQRRQADLKQHIAEQRGPIEDISRLSSAALADAQSEMTQSRTALDRSGDALVMTLGAAILLTLVLTSGVTVLVAERQINRRLARLTAAATAIAQGQTDTAVEVSGPDELGRIARALDIFKANADELQRSKEEIDKFAYVAAHDLRTPLRAIKDLVDWTLDDKDTVLSADSRLNLSLMKARVERLNTLLADLLEYARVERKEDTLAPVSMPEMLTELEQLLDPERRYPITFIGDPGPFVTYATPLRQILLNLIGNAMKHHDETEGKIIVNAQVSGGQLICQVEDDGPGIPPAYHDRVFGLFQTLRPRDDVEGSGIGLAIIHKLLTAYGGTIHVDSNPKRGRGTIFVFAMPVSTAAAEHHQEAA